MKQKELAKSITKLLAGSALVFGTTSASASYTMYNLYNASDEPRVTDGSPLPLEGQVGGTDGWVWGAVGGVSGGNPDAANPGWIGPNGHTTTNVFNSTKAIALNWAAHVTATDDSLEISQADAVERYGEFGVYPDIDTAGGAWLQAVGNGWRHNIDIGLFKSDVKQNVILNIQGILSPSANFGITLYKGLSSSETVYGHHGPYFGNSGHDFEGMEHIKFTPRDPSTGLTTNSLSFLADAGQIYTVILGGNNGENWNKKFDGYKLSISTSPVPVPGAVWLFGSALAGFIGVQRRKKAIG
jgi:hypothetical protein